MIYLIGSKTEYFPDDYGINLGVRFENTEKKLVAVFDTEELAKSYIDKCKLKRPIRNIWVNDEIFKRSTLLNGYGDVEISTSPYDFSLIDKVPRNPK